MSLVGHCQEGGEQILIYEYMPNGDLRKYLHGEFTIFLFDANQTWWELDTLSEFMYMKELSNFVEDGRAFLLSFLTTESWLAAKRFEKHTVVQWLTNLNRAGDANNSGLPKTILPWKLRLEIALSAAQGKVVRDDCNMIWMPTLREWFKSNVRYSFCAEAFHMDHYIH